MSIARSRRTRPLLLPAAVAVLGLFAACGGGSGGETTTPQASDPATETFASSLGVDLASMTKLSPDLYIKDVTVGSGAVPVTADSIIVTYTGWLANGTQFDSNVGGSPFTFSLGTGEVIRGWDQGLAGMRVGGTRLLVIGSALGYGPAGRATIPPNATLVFTVQLTGIKPR
ncbi:MAG: FKBP-type peptidyl-prolyl cis-trans isomerase [Gemmatimonadales bacterium]